MVKKGLLSKVGFGVYTAFGSVPTWHQQAAIAVFSCGSGALLSHESVLTYFGLIEQRTRNAITSDGRSILIPIHILTRRYEYHRQNVIFHRSTAILRDDVYMPSIGIPHVSLSRAFMDAASNLMSSELDFALEKAFQKKLVTPHQVELVIQRTPSGPGRPKKKLLEILTPYLLDGSQQQETESVLEKRVARVISNHFPWRCETQWELISGQSRYRLDFAFPELKIAVEVDGFAFHRNRSQFDNDRLRQNAILASNWKLVRITSTFSDEQIIRAVSEAISLPS